MKGLFGVRTVNRAAYGQLFVHTEDVQALPPRGPFFFFFFFSLLFHFVPCSVPHLQALIERESKKEGRNKNKIMPPTPFFFLGIGKG